MPPFVVDVRASSAHVEVETGSKIRTMLAPIESSFLPKTGCSSRRVALDFFAGFSSPSRRSAVAESMSTAFTGHMPPTGLFRFREIH